MWTASGVVSQSRFSLKARILPERASCRRKSAEYGVSLAIRPIGISFPISSAVGKGPLGGIIVCYLIVFCFGFLGASPILGLLPVATSAGGSIEPTVIVAQCTNKFKRWSCLQTVEDRSSPFCRGIIAVKHGSYIH